VGMTRRKTSGKDLGQAFIAELNPVCCVASSTTSRVTNCTRVMKQLMGVATQAFTLRTAKQLGRRHRACTGD